MSARSSASFRVATSRSRSLTAGSPGDAASSSLISSSVSPARCAVPMTVRILSTARGYRLRPLIRSGAGMSPMRS